jgi:hypothetical protein
MKSHKHITMNLGKIQSSSAKTQQESNNETPKHNSVATRPPPEVDAVVSSSQSLTSSIGIGEFGMNQSRRGSAVAFSMAVKDYLFPKLKFLKGTNASLDFSMDATSICGYLRVCCGVSEADAYQWWDDHRIMLKNIHTDFRNNKIKMIKQQFNGKLQQLNNFNVKHQVLTLIHSSLLTSLDQGRRKSSLRDNAKRNDTETKPHQCRYIHQVLHLLWSSTDWSNILEQQQEYQNGGRASYHLR